MKKKPVYKYIGMTTGRLTSGKFNLSSVPKHARALFVPDKKKVLFTYST